MEDISLEQKAQGNAGGTDNLKRLDDYGLCRTVRRIADRICQIAEEHGCWFEDRRFSRPNPSYNQTASGLFIEHYYGSVNILWTPWGSWQFIGSSSGNWDQVWDEVVELLGATLDTPFTTTPMGSFGPVFAITKFGEHLLPKAVVLDRRQYSSPEEVAMAWAWHTATNLGTSM
jgi:hypothetical protein